MRRGKVAPEAVHRQPEHAIRVGFSGCEAGAWQARTAEVTGAAGGEVDRFTHAIRDRS
jgi:hypothetical protein